MWFDSKHTFFKVYDTLTKFAFNNLESWLWSCFECVINLDTIYFHIYLQLTLDLPPLSRSEANRVTSRRSQFNPKWLLQTFIREEFVCLWHSHFTIMSFWAGLAGPDSFGTQSRGDDRSVCLPGKTNTRTTQRAGAERGCVQSVYAKNECVCATTTIKWRG